MRDPKMLRALLAASAGAAVVVMAGALLTVASKPVLANPAIAQKTGEQCAKCHTAAPALNAYGKKYKETLKK